MDIIPLIRLAYARGASDLHLAAMSPPDLRIDGAITSISDTPLTPDETRQAFDQLTTAEEKEEFARDLELDFAYSVPDLVRLRCNAAMHRGTISLSMRLIPVVVPTIEELNLPGICQRLVLEPRGLIIVSGPTGSGKSSTLAAMIEYLNCHEGRRIVTIEDPLEYLFMNKQSNIIQRELGNDTHTFAHALKHVLRQDPDVIMVGEMRDLETAAALAIAETGHLVLTTGHAPSSSQAVERVIDLFPINERAFAQARMASLLVGIMCQMLIPRAEEKGRVPAVEVMLANVAVKSLIREGKIHQLPNVISTHTDEGMQTLDRALIELYKKGIIAGKSLMALCKDRDEVVKIVGGDKLKDGEFKKALLSSLSGEAGGGLKPPPSRIQL